MLHAGLSADQQVELVHTLEVAGRQDDSSFSGLLVALASEVLVGATWVQLAAGQTAVAWLPAANSPAAADLMRAAARFLDEHRVVLAQFLVSDESALNYDLLAATDFRRLAKLAYLAVDRRCFPAAAANTELSFLQDASGEPQRLGQLLLRTYEDSLDCPQLNGVRHSGDVLTGYQEQGTFASERWFFVQHHETDIGTLILTTHADSGNWELVYMGLVPAARGNGWGRQILEFALWQARLGGARRLVLAVDEANQPALDMYHRAGFVAWDYRTVFARLRRQMQEKEIVCVFPLR